MTYLTKAWILFTLPMILIVFGIISNYKEKNARKLNDLEAFTIGLIVTVILPVFWGIYFLINWSVTTQ